MRQIDPETNTRAEFGNFEGGGQVRGVTMRYDKIKRLSDISREGVQIDQSYRLFTETCATLVLRSLSRIWSVSNSFYHEFHEWTNDTNLFWFSIRTIRLFVPFVISNHLIPHRQDSYTGCLQHEMSKSRIKREVTRNEP